MLSSKKGYQNYFRDRTKSPLLGTDKFLTRGKNTTWNRSPQQRLVIRIDIQNLFVRLQVRTFES